METFLTVLLIWITSNVLFVGWRLWVSRSARDDCHRWEYDGALARGPRHHSLGTAAKERGYYSVLR